MPILNYTTKIDSYKTLTEIQQIITKRGATKIVIDNTGGIPTGLSFHIRWHGQMVAFAMPCNFSGVLAAMKKGKAPKNLCTQEQAIRVGWRILKVWIEGQMAIVDAEVATLAEVFLPYSVTKDGSTLYQFLDNEPEHLLLSHNS